jgi:hypothetical protein
MNYLKEILEPVIPLLQIAVILGGIWIIQWILSKF